MVRLYILGIGFGVFLLRVCIFIFIIYLIHAIKLESSFAIYIQIFLLHWADFLELHIYINIS